MRSGSYLQLFMQQHTCGRSVQVVLRNSNVAAVVCFRLPGPPPVVEGKEKQRLSPAYSCIFPYCKYGPDPTGEADALNMQKIPS